MNSDLNHIIHETEQPLPGKEQWGCMKDLVQWEERTCPGLFFLFKQLELQAWGQTALDWTLGGDVFLFFSSWEKGAFAQSRGWEGLTIRALWKGWSA